MQKSKTVIASLLIASPLFANETEKNIIPNLLEVENVSEHFETIDDMVFAPNRSANTVNSNIAWPDNIMPYKIGKGFGPLKKKMIKKAADEISRLTSLKLVERTNEETYVTISKSDKTGCYAFVGHSNDNSYNRVNLGIGCRNKGTIIHELTHAAGFGHEHNRADRDNYVKIHFNNIKSGLEHNFEKGYFDHGTYDYGSIMHYGSRAFSDGLKKTITKKNGDKIKEQREKLSHGDIESYAFYYPGQDCAPYLKKIKNKRTWAQISIPQKPNGTVISFKNGAARRMCHRVMWKDLRFICADGKWIQEGDFKNDRLCHGRFKSQPYLTAGGKKMRR